VSRFLSLLGIRELEKSEVDASRLDVSTDYFRLTESLEYESELVGRIVVPVGFVTDFASTPRLVWWLIPPEDYHYTRGAVVHDWIYNQHLYQKAVCDLVFLEAMTALQTPKWKRTVMYLAVKWFGASAYNNERKQLITV